MKWISIKDEHPPLHTPLLMWIGKTWMTGKLTFISEENYEYEAKAPFTPDGVEKMMGVRLTLGWSSHNDVYDHQNRQGEMKPLVTHWCIPDQPNE